MCGIAGIYGGSPSENALEAMASCIGHRGPDDSSVYRDGAVGFAHTRLSIIGLSTGDQPIFNEDGDVAVIFNGEIYNYQSLKADLASRGHTFTTNTDTEVLVHLYEEYGRSFVDHLEGMFAFALWDSTADRLLLARDPMGIKPLLLADDGRCIAFASELPALFDAGVDIGTLDETALSQYFSLGYIPAPKTAFTNVRKLEPGELAVVSGGEVEREQFYTPSIQSREVCFDTAMSGLRSRVEDAVEKRLMSEVPLGAFLSGGIDSSIIVGIMAHLTDEPVKTFTVGFDESLFDETWAAREVATYHGTDHTSYTVEPGDIRDAIPAVLDRFGEPFADQSILPTYIVARETSNDVTVALSGDGADELFAGYSRYRGEYYSRYYRMIPAVARRSVIEPVVEGLGASRGSSRGEAVRQLQKFVRGGTARTPDRHFEWARFTDDDALTSVRCTDPADAGRARLRQAHEDICPCLPLTRRDDMARLLAVDTYFGLPNQILAKTDRASMYNSLEVRVPFLDTAVAEYAMSLPTAYKITPREQKRVLKRTFDDLLPDRILQRDKQGFDMPIGEWFKDELRDEFVTTISALETDLVDTDAVLDHFGAHERGRAEHGKFLWTVYVFARWHNRLRAQEVI